MIPQNITRYHIFEALKEIDKVGYPDERESTGYYLRFNEKNYPPKVVISIANRFANGQELDSSVFGGGSEANTYLRSKGFDIETLSGEPVSDEQQADDIEQSDFARKLKEYLEHKFNVRIVRYGSKAPLMLPSNSQIYVRGSREIESTYGYYHLVKSNYEKIVTKQDQYFAVVYKDPTFTFIFDGEELKEIFGRYQPTIPKNRPLRWHFDLMEKEGHYYLKLHNRLAKEVPIDSNLNKWDQIKDFAGKSESSLDAKNSNAENWYFLVQVSKRGSENLLRNNTYEHRDWRKNTRDRAHGEVRAGDSLVVYFASNSIRFGKQIKKIYQVNSVSKDNLKFGVSETRELNGITFERIKLLMEQGKLHGEAFKKIGNEGFNIARIEKSDYDQIIALDKTPRPTNASGISSSYLVDYIMNHRMNENYQVVVIKTLVDNNGAAVKRQLIEQQLRNYNPGSTSKSMTDTVIGVLKNNGIIMEVAVGSYILNLSNELGDEGAAIIKSLCEARLTEMAKAQSLIRYWKIAPGENAYLWNENKENQVIAIGWSQIGDLSDHNLDRICAEITSKYPASSSAIIPQFENFLSIKKGDIIIANRGISKVVGIGEVTGPYKYRPELTFHHTYPVDWFDVRERDIPPQTGTWRPTVRPVTSELYEQIISDRWAEHPMLDWSFDIDKAVDEIIARDTEKELAIDKEIVRRTITHLKAGKHVILAGPPGVGKTYLAKRILDVIGRKVTGNNNNFIESVASDEWSRYEVIGGINLENKFQEGYIVKAVSDQKWLLIDEFNRANMNKAFGEMFLAIEYGKITLRPTEGIVYGKDFVEIPQDFRMICTMNDFDKNLLLTELSYGLLNRFAFVSIVQDVKREPLVVRKRVEPLLRNNDNYEMYNEQIKLYFMFMNEVRSHRNIGVRTSIDVVKFLIADSRDDLINDNIIHSKWESLNNALCDYVLPQFDRLDGQTIDYVLKCANLHLYHEAFDPFREELQNINDRLQKASGWLAGK